MTYIITGTAGFIASHLAETLLQSGNTVIGIDEVNDYYDIKFKVDNLERLSKYSKFQFLRQSIKDVDWKSLLINAKPDVIFHQAAQAGVRASWGDGFKLYTERNIDATQIMLEAVKLWAPRLYKFVYAGTSSIYGDAETFPTSELVPPKPVSPYGITKLAAEQLGFLYQKNFNVPFTSLRYFTVYGPGQRPDMAFHKFMRNILRGEPIDIYGDGMQTRDFTYVDDIVKANLLGGCKDSSTGEIFNIGGGHTVTVNQVLDMIEKVTGLPVYRNHIEKAIGDARDTSADTNKAQSLLGYKPTTSLEQGLEKEWEWIKGIYA